MLNIERNCILLSFPNIIFQGERNIFEWTDQLNLNYILNAFGRTKALETYDPH